MPADHPATPGAPGAGSTHRPAHSPGGSPQPTTIHVTPVHSARAQRFPNRRGGATGLSFLLKTLDPSSHYTSRARSPFRQLLTQPNKFFDGSVLMPAGARARALSRA
ncbi:hypothetical protein BOSE62_80114 [Bosea sp. 62]|nr:hypothetical protein BOSE21B_80038 [Bosea sp. 21B]CAD5292428.1 hypothetical protein BOSE46_80017 [Bosea sp. 46]VXC68285.1 hypothetical protein BOSE29B_70016 [Bosea sp. 29B]VXC83916.1 hypothetical protein BOSE125_530002 [Bosea sp. 125]VXC96230.1 hypothetical protein BOSE62_80114 [Bosea sp. 62]